MKATIVRCDQCGETISEGGRRFKLLAVVTIINGHERQASSEQPDICGEACVISSVTALIREADTMPPVAAVTANPFGNLISKGVFSVEQSSR